jgi:hypothetical protein
MNLMQTIVPLIIARKIIKIIFYAKLCITYKINYSLSSYVANLISENPESTMNI